APTGVEGTCTEVGDAHAVDLIGAFSAGIAYLDEDVNLALVECRRRTRDEVVHARRGQHLEALVTELAGPVGGNPYRGEGDLVVRQAVERRHVVRDALRHLDEPCTFIRWRTVPSFDLRIDFPLRCEVTTDLRLE